MCAWYDFARVRDKLFLMVPIRTCSEWLRCWYAHGAHYSSYGWKISVSICQSIHSLPCWSWTLASLMVTISRAGAWLKSNRKPNQIDFHGFIVHRDRYGPENGILFSLSGISNSWCPFSNGFSDCEGIISISFKSSMTQLPHLKRVWTATSLT